MARPRKKETFRGNADGFGKVESIQEEKAEPEQPAPEPKEGIGASTANNSKYLPFKGGFLNIN